MNLSISPQRSAFCCANRACRTGTVFTLLILWFLTTLSVSAEEPSRLNSDQITQRFGSYAVEVMSQSESLRLANLYSTHDGVKICRTLALTAFQLPVAEDLMEADAAIREGASIGATLRAAGWRVVKSDAAFAIATAGQQFAELSAGTVDVGSAVAVQVYSLQVSNGETRHPYAVIAEAYHPEHIPAGHDWQQAARPIEQVIESVPTTQKEALSALASALN